MHILEYGPGESTKLFQAHDSVVSIETIEHSVAWAEKIKPHLGPKVNLTLEPKGHKYAYSGPRRFFDLIFIDGIERPACMSVALFRLGGDGVVIVHDAERLEYRQAMELWNFKYFADEGHTAFLTNDIKVGHMLSEMFK